MFIHIWKDMQGKLFKRLQAAELAGTSLSTHTILVYRQNEGSARLYNTIPTSYTAGLFNLRQDNSVEFKVNLFNQAEEGSGSCSCGRFQNDRLPCSHRLALIHQLRLAPLRLIASFYTKPSWVAIYQQELPPLLRSSLSFGESILPQQLNRRGGVLRRREESKAVTV